MEEINQKKVFSTNLRKFVAAAGKTQAEIAKTVGVSPQTFNTWMQGIAIPRMGKIQALANFFDINKSALIEEENNQIVQENLALTSTRKVRSLPILGTIACGAPIWAEENFEGYVNIDPEHMDGEFALICKGDSMIDAEIHDGDIVLMKKTQDVEDGKIAAVLIDDEATLKKVYKRDDSLVLQPCNSEYGPIVYSNREVENHGIQIIGEYVGAYHPKKR
ncbi:helix-turn-helix domain-containing protein [Murdochiella sp. Marseille-P8839]|nr:helix-turn-helix domain-containing protein [Murdochiella sp. Marseille-P8839]